MDSVVIDWRDSIPPGIDGMLIVEGITLDEYEAFRARWAAEITRIEVLAERLAAAGYGVEFIPLKEPEMSAPNTPDVPYTPRPDGPDIAPSEGHAEPGDRMLLEITADPLSIRPILQEMIDKLRGPDGRAASREVALAITKLQEARYWLGESQFGSGA